MAPPPAIHLRVSMAGERASKLNRRYGQQRSTWEQHRWLLQRWPIHLRVSMAGERASKLNRRYHPDHLNTWVPNLQDIISVAFAVAYIFRIYSEPIRCYYITSLTGVVDFLSIIPVIFLFRQFRRGGHVIRLLQFLRIVRIFSSLDQIGLEGSTVTQQIVFLVASTFGAIFLDAGIIQWIESNAAPPHIKEQCAPQGCLTFWEAFYFLIVTIATVGYGDIVAKTILGQVAVIISILVALAVLPTQIGRISSLASNRPYGGSFNPHKILGSKFLVLSGSINIHIVQNFLASFYTTTHSEDLEIYPLHVIILAPFKPSFEMKRLLSFYNGQAEFIEGSPMHQIDLERVSANKASAIFLLANQEAKDTKIEDETQIVRALTVNSFCHNSVRIIVEVLDPEMQNSAIWDNTRGKAIEVICPIKLHFKMLSRSCLIKGLYTLITNIFSSEVKLTSLPSEHYMSEYFDGFLNEVYPLIFPNALHNLMFEEVAEFLFTSFNVILFALDIPLESVESDNTRREVLLHPKGHCIQPDDIGIVMARNIHTVYAISSFEGDTDESNCFGKLLRNRSSKRRKGIDGKEQLQNVSNRWQQIGSVASFRRQTVQGADLYMDGSHPHDVPSSPDGQGKLKSHLKSAICKVVSGIVTCTEKLEDSDHAEFLEFRGAGGEEEDLHRVVEENARLDEHPESLSLENALDEILLWPSSSQYGRPHLAVLDQQRSNILQNLEERTRTIVDLSKPHILVCCQGTWPQNIFYFLNGLRKPKFPNPPIVILHPDQPTATEWGTIGIFKDIFFLKGSPIYELDLMRGGIIQAEKVVILASQGTPVFGYGRGSEESHQKASGVYSSDVDNIIIIANIERILGGGIDKVIVEMHHAVGSHYLWPQFDISKNHVSKKECSRNQDALVQFTPPFMEGRVVCPRMLSFLFHSSFYNRNTVSIVEQLVEGGHVESGKGVSYNHRRVLEQIPVPIKYVNCMYSDLFMDLLTENGMLALGLYRARGTLGSLAAYVFTNPPKNTKVNGADLVFVLI
ncbi:hypothetical protein O6H91_03G117500 [Diphasiastrum complanatum]|uniref:Uncharacterized protein n=1 Tax=Diphasiastrum complanatum TaxID=34168 RepID=A0ACC2EB94_DIPCM|nr:hypothetical protein O6H91_03G117500 [Diphasiastrum complanatum]